jgi:hypothetical protein
MAKVLQAPQITFECDHCRALCEANADEFQRTNTMPPMWQIQCPYVGSHDTMALLREHPMMKLMKP